MIENLESKFRLYNHGFCRKFSCKIIKRPKNKVTELGVAASIGDLSAVDYFLKVCGLSVDAADERGWRAIHHAALHGQQKVVDLLVRRGASINSRTVSGLTPLLLASTCLTERYPTLDALLTAGAKPDCRSPQGWIKTISLTPRRAT